MYLWRSIFDVIQKRCPIEWAYSLRYKGAGRERNGGEVLSVRVAHFSEFRVINYQNQICWNLSTTEDSWRSTFFRHFWFGAPSTSQFIGCGVGARRGFGVRRRSRKVPHPSTDVRPTKAVYTIVFSSLDNNAESELSASVFRKLLLRGVS